MAEVITLLLDKKAHKTFNLGGLSRFWKTPSERAVF